MASTKKSGKKETLKKKVEEMGVFFENFDHTPTSARIVSFLLIAQPHYQDFDSIREFLQASKSTISTTLNMLASKGMVDYMTLPGDRKRYFKVNTEKWLDITLKSIDKTTALKVMLQQILEFRDEKEAPEFYKGIENLRDFFIHLDKYLAMAVDDWIKQQK